jgi:hypothetical protein
MTSRCFWKYEKNWYIHGDACFFPSYKAIYYFADMHECQSYTCPKSIPSLSQISGTQIVPLLLILPTICDHLTIFYKRRSPKQCPSFFLTSSINTKLWSKFPLSFYPFLKNLTLIFATRWDFIIPLKLFIIIPPHYYWSCTRCS